MTASFPPTAVAAMFAASLIASAVPASAQSAQSWRAGQAPDTPIRTTDLPPSGAAPVSEIADRYLERARTDRANADVWVYCAAAAMKRGIAGDADADAYARDIAAVVRPSLHRGAGSPCEDAIPTRIWDVGEAATARSRDETPTAGTSPQVADRGAGGGFLVPPDDAVTASDPGALTPAEEERLRRANAAADAQEQARVAAQAATQQRQTDAQARYQRERADYESQVAAARAADADYQRQLEAHRRLLESGQYQAPR